MRFLVTGGAGFIGSALVRHLIANGDEVVTLDSLTYAGHVESLVDALQSSKHCFERVDIRDRAAVGEVFQRHQPDVVMHLAAESHVDRSIDSPMDFVTTNVVGTVNMLDAATQHWRALSGAKKDAFRLLHVSTDEVYGSLGPTGVFTEDTPYQPNSPYSASKASSDHFARSWHRTYGLPVLISHCSNNYGPFQMPEKLIPVIVLAAMEGRPIPIYGTGKNIRDWLFVDDHVSALIAIATKGQVGEVYNVGADQEITNIDMARRICAWLDRLLPVSPHGPHANLIKFVADRPGHDLRYAIDSSRVRHELGWAPQQGLEEGLGLTVRWYVENDWWWRGIRDGGFEDARRQGLTVGA